MARGRKLPAFSAAVLLLSCAPRVAPRPATVQAAQRGLLSAPSNPLAVRAAPSPVQTQIEKPNHERSDAAATVTEARASGDTNTAKAPAQTVALDVPDFSPAVVRFANGLGKAPILIVAHGAGGTPEAHCDLWARISKGKALLLCVRGRARSPLPADGDYYPDHPTLERETFAALSALRARFPDRIAAGPVFYAGFSQGATMGALMLVEHASEVTRLVLVEGGFADWNVARAIDFHAHGGERVLFVCGRKECAEPARNAVHWFNAAGVAARLEYVVGAGHSHDARVEARIAALYPWFVQGDPRWQTNKDDVSASKPR